MLSKDELNLAELGIGVNGDGKTKTALFCVIPDSDKSYNYIIGMLYTQIFQELYYQADFVCGGRLPVHVTFMLDEFSNVALPDDYCSLLSTMRSREISSVIIIQNLAQIKALFKDTWETIPGNYDVLGREIMMPDEVRKMDNKKCLIFIRGFDPIMDDKYSPFSHPMFSQTADGDGVPYEHKPAKEGESAEPGFTILNKKSLEYYEGLKQKGEPVYIDAISYEDFMLLGPVEVNKRFTDMDEQEKKGKLYEDMEPELEFAFDTEEDMPEPFVTEPAGNREFVAEQKAEPHISKSVDSEKDSIPYRLFHWRFTVEQKEELKRAMDARVPKEVILSYFYPETSVVKMMEIRRQYE